MRAALEVCGEFLSRIGALEDANAIADILHKTGVELSATSPFRWRALLAAIRHELDAKPMDIVFLFERLLQLDATMPSDLSYALFESPLFLHLLVERFAVAFQGLDTELFKLESDEMCHAEGIYETCILLRDKIEENENGSRLTTFLETFRNIFEQNDPKVRDLIGLITISFRRPIWWIDLAKQDCWDAFYDLYHLDGAAFRRDMRRALCRIESVTLGPTKLELAFPTKAADGPKKVVPRALLEKRFGGTRREWRDLSKITGDLDRAADDKQAQEQEQEVHTVASTVNGEATESVHSDISKEASTPKRPVSSRPPRAVEVARVTRQEGRRAAPRAAPRARGPSEGNSSIERRSNGRLSGRRKRVRWSAEEETALMEGYRLYESYPNVWMLIKTKFSVVLQNRSNVDLKDKYRNLVRYGRIPRDMNDNAGVTDNDTTDDNAGGVDENDTTDA